MLTLARPVARWISVHLVYTKGSDGIPITLPPPSLPPPSPDVIDFILITGLYEFPIHIELNNLQVQYNTNFTQTNKRSCEEILGSFK